MLRVRDLRVQFGDPATPVRAVDGVSFDLAAGRCVALVGESGSGKSVTALALMRLLPQSARYASGRVEFDGRDVASLSWPELKRLRGGHVAYIFQEPAVALNPVLPIRRQILEALRLHAPESATDAEVARLLGAVRLPDPDAVARAYPHELSGGMQQRVMIAMALAGRPRLLVADEPTTALDVTVQAQILELLVSLQRDLGMALLLITHNLALVAKAADRVCVMYAGRIVESGPARDLLTAPRHPYTRALLRAVPRLRGGDRLEGIPGSIPHAAAIPPGCRFHPRCPIATELCARVEPTPQTMPDGRGVECHFARDAAALEAAR